MRKQMESKWSFAGFLYLFVLITALSLSSCGGGGGGGLPWWGGGGGGDTTAPTATVDKLDGSFIKTTGVLKVEFSESMDIATLIASMGTTTLTGTWSQTTSTNDTVTFSGIYSEGTQTFTLDAKDKAGNPLAQLVRNYTVYNSFLYVSTAGDDANNGTSTVSPKRTIQAAIAVAGTGLSKDVLVSAGTYTVDSKAGVAGNQIVLVEGISLYGGYSADFSVRSVATTTITDLSTAVGVSRAMQAGTGITAATVVDGFTINGSISGGNNTVAIYNISGGAPFISHNTIHGGNGSAKSYAIYNDSSSPTISSNNINGGGSVSSYAIYNVSSSPTISNNTINGGISTGVVSSATVAIYNSGSSPTISNNTIDGGSSTAVSYAIQNMSSSSPTISNNTINGGSGSTSSTAITNNNSSPTIQNNTLNGGIGGSSSRAIYNFNSPSPLIRNNTIDGGSSAGGSTAILNTNSAPTIQNNILFTSGGASRYCFNEGDATSDPTAFTNNDLFGCPTALYRDESGDNFIMIDEVNAMLDTTTGGNVSVDPSFVNQAAGDYHLQSSSSVDVREGGQDLTATIPTDKDGVTRTAVKNGSPSNPGSTGVSIGAYEKD